MRFNDACSDWCKVAGVITYTGWVLGDPKLSVNIIIIEINKITFNVIMMIPALFDFTVLEEMFTVRSRCR